MSDPKIVQGGVTYIRSRDAARIVQLAPDYVSRLARENAVDGRQVVGLWFVNLASLKDFIIEQDALFRILCPLFGGCPRDDVIATS